ncbi:hypothetical protein [Deinococcus multiflagellatus]|uniref:Uncharacterized protein n=1 Tax=Deinococcus multiflagellatus TaxID=1656887 RepID=A0ABW1ZS59_9DEIO|nr:hypothetical protein [Deinococcus multiflagellatus]MBZ9714481.1 hypothetical protein [Deinococcus multiflagellatus]
MALHPLVTTEVGDTERTLLAVVRPDEDPERFPLAFGHLPRRERQAALRVVLDLAQAALPVARVATPLDFSWPAALAADELTYFLELDAPVKVTRQRVEQARKQGYDGLDPWLLAQEVAEVDGALSAAEVTRRGGPWAHALSLTQALAARTEAFKSQRVCTADHPYAGLWVPPLLSCCFSPESGTGAALAGALNDDYHRAMETGEFGITVAYDLRTSAGRDATVQLVGQADDLRLAILAIAEVLLWAGAEIGD